MGASWHSKIPWDLAKQLYYQFRVDHFSAEPPDWGYTTIKATEKEILLKMGSLSYAPNGNWLSYDKGEDINLARVVSIPWDSLNDSVQEEILEYQGEAEGDVTWWQFHFRAWDQGDGTYKVNGHVELEPWTSDSAHIDGVGFHNKRGIRKLVEDMEEVNIEIMEYPGFMGED